MLRFAGVSRLLITDLTNIRYLTGLSLSAGSILVTRTEYRLYVDDRYIETAKAAVRKPVRAFPAAQMEKDLRGAGPCGFEERHVSVATLRRWKTTYKKTSFVRTENAVEHFRRQKDAAELALMNKAKRITEELFDAVPLLLEAGVTEKQVAWALEAIARDLGADGFSFDPIVAFGAHTSRPHHRASDRKLRKNDIVQLDIGVVYKGYASDLSRVFFMAKPTKAQAQALHAVAEAKEAAVNAAKEGMSAAELDALARSILKKHKLERYFTHALGHGVGMEVHEGITLSRRDPRPLLKNEVVAIEPGVYFPGKFGIRLEDTVVIR